MTFHPPTKCQNVLSRCALGAALFALACPGETTKAAEPVALRVLGDEHPRAFFFRHAEGVAAQGVMPYDRWEQTFGRLMGVMGKVLDEEVPGRSRGLETFVRFKRAHPEQAVLLHLNGNSRDPRYEGHRFFAGHWLYHNGATVLEDVRPASGETTLHVSDARLFEVGGGRYLKSNDDIGLCEIGPDGRPDWSRSEQVQLVAVDRAAGTLHVRRGAFGTSPRAFSGGRAHAAAHSSEGPWGAESRLLWNYNYATTCPRDGQGRTAADVFVGHLVELFTGAGPLAAFDGLEFDVLFNAPNASRRPIRGVDCDADGKRDNGLIDGVNVYGNGVTAFCRSLRAALGPRKLILADGAFRFDNAQRATGILNGIESEGWPALGDFTIEDWSGGLNRHEFWRTHAHAPAFSYANVKFVARGEAPGDMKQAAVPFARVRLAFAGALFTDSAITFAHRPDTRPGAAGIWDELIAGEEGRVAWLGRALGPARHLCDDTPDQSGLSPLDSAALRARLKSQDGDIVLDGSAVRISGKAGASEFSVSLADLPLNGGDLCVTMVARSDPMAGTSSDTARLLHAAVHAPGATKPHGSEIMSWVGRDNFASRFYFRSTPQGRVEVRFKFESREAVWISAIEVHAAPDLVAREFARGLVLANPSDQPREFNLSSLWPNRTWRRLRGTPGQDQATNNGKPAGATVVLPPRDALFLAAGTP